MWDIAAASRKCAAEKCTLGGLKTGHEAVDARVREVELVCLAGASGTLLGGSMGEGGQNMMPLLYQRRCSGRMRRRQWRLRSVTSVPHCCAASHAGDPQREPNHCGVELSAYRPNSKRSRYPTACDAEPSRAWAGTPRAVAIRRSSSGCGSAVPFSISASRLQGISARFATCIWSRCRSNRRSFALVSFMRNSLIPTHHESRSRHDANRGYLGNPLRLV